MTQKIRSLLPILIITQLAITGCGQGNYSTGTSELARKIPFRERIIIIEPRFGHPKVSNKTIAMVKGVINGLPPHLYELLDRGNARITIAPNIIDKWPEAIDKKLPNVKYTIAETPGRTYDNGDVHIFERSIIPGTKKLREPFALDHLRRTTLHELCHAIDACAGAYSEDPVLRKLHKEDVDNLSEAEKVDFWYQLQPMEACADIVCNHIGGATERTRLIEKKFPRTREFLIRKLKLE